MNSRTKKITILAMFIAVAYVIMLVGRISIIPSVEFLKYDPKDAIIAICGFVMGPLSAFVVTLIVSLIEMLTVSNTGPIGLLMNVLSTVGFVCTAAFFYKRHRTLGGAFGGLAIGSAVMVAVMIAWNYLITPIYMGVPREQVAGMLLTVFLPFNVLKAGINAALSLMLYKPISKALINSGLVTVSLEHKNGKLSPVPIIVAILLLITCVLVILAMRDII